ncbi:hypothetical protein MUO14_06840 [Halobacillus shinanisalinarum]|uniref:Uncharacterized protein n=1 Tax=Halobacillus shinanisalinarum TaxID=2932258 RepID=A0ABY4H2K2_9BACI|nr:hypothetical protein [Halobacillus shinanisalinarum]UOQ94658.1 hypothetical protein MUO14_06840 [Halobacillus shinanisalinarum]
MDDYSSVRNVEDMDEVREMVDRELTFDGRAKWLTISFTKNKKWAL